MFALPHLFFLLLSLSLSVDAKPITGGRKDIRFNRPQSRQDNQALYLQQAQAAEANRNSGWKAMGCIRDSPTRTLDGTYVSWSNMTLPICMNYCLGKGYTYGGVQYGVECWCGNEIKKGTYTTPLFGTTPNYIKSGDPYGVLVPYSECEVIPCAGDKTTNCGNNWRNNVFAVADRTAALAAISASAAASASAASASAASVSAASSLSAYSSRAAVFSSSAAAAYSSSAVQYSISSLAAYSSQASAYSSQAAAYSSQAAAYSSSQAVVFSSSSAAAARASASAYSSSSLAASAAAWSAAAAASTAASLAAYSSNAAAYSTAQSLAAYSASAAQYSVSSAAAASSAAQYSQSVAAAQYSQSVAQYSQSVAAASAAQYSQSVAQYSASSSAAASASRYSQAAAQYSQSVAQYSQSVAQYSQSVAAASASQYSQSVAAASAAQYSASVAQYSASSIAAASAAQYSASAAQYSQSVAAASAAKFSESVAQYSQSVAQYSQSVAQYSQSVAASSASQYSASSIAAASAAQYSGSVAAASAAAYSASSLAASASAYSANQIAQASASAYSASSAAAAQASEAAYSASASAAAAAAATAIPSTWSAARTSCVAEGTTGRALTGASVNSPGMSYGRCIKYCNDAGFVLAGVQYSTECYCGNILENGASLDKQSTNCNMKCGGSADICGGPSALTLFVANAALSSLSEDFTSKPVALANGWKKAATECVQEGTTGRALTGASMSDDAMIPSKCMAFCESKNFKLAGVEYGRECYCGNELSNGASYDRVSQTCNMGCAGNPSIYCGGPNGIQLFSNPTIGQSQDAAASASSSAAAASSSAAAAAQSSTAAANQAKLPSGWNAASSPCIEEVNGRALNAASTAGDDMTVEKCINFCSNKGYSLAGLEYGGECYCANSLQNGASLDRKANTCNMKCNGDSTQICGGPNGISLYSGTPSAVSSATPSASATVKAGPSLATDLPTGWSASGSNNCIQEVAGRALTGYSEASGDMTITKCINICSGKGFKLAGVEYASECFCGNSLSNGARVDLLSEQCNMACSGDSKTLCGGPNAIQLYTNPNVTPASTASTSTSAAASGPTLAGNLPSGWSAASTNCIEEVGGRALTGYSTSQDDMTIPKCIGICSGKGFKYAGVEYASECFCGNDLSNGASLDKASQQCNMGCSGDKTSLCGGPNAIQLYTNPDVKVAISSAAASSSTSTAAAAATPTPAKNLPTGWVASSTSCLQEVAGRALTGSQASEADMTIPKCLTICEGQGFHYAGVQYGSECFCGATLSNGASLDKASNQCTMSCSGDKSTLCGGPNAIQLYENAGLMPSATTINGFTSKGCMQEVVGRALNATSLYAGDMTVEKCIGYCNDKGYSMAGLEYGEECFCGNSLANSASLSSVSYECKYPCAGNNKQICGGPDAINLYVKN